MTRRSSRALLLAAIVAAVPRSSTAQPAPRADAPPQATAAEQPEVHFRRAVTLYKDGDYAGALVEFRRAYELSPNYRVLYNIGQSLYQLQRYADALTTFESYLAQGGAQIADARRTSVEGDIRQLQARVGRVQVAVNLEGAEVRVDDETVGTSPLAAPVRVSIGHRKITVAKAGRVPIERFVDVAAGDRVQVSLEFPEQPPAVALVPAPPPASAPAPVVPPAPEPTVPPPLATHDVPPPGSSPSIPWVPWAVAGVFAAGTIVTGALTLAAKGDLTSKLDAYPGDPAAIDQDRNRAKTFSYVSDGLLAATVVSAGIAAYFTFVRRAPAASVNVGLGVGVQGVEVRGEY
jgi:hypothetical protein